MLGIRKSKKAAAEVLLAYSLAAGAETQTQIPANHADPTRWSYGGKTPTIGNLKPEFPTPKLHPTPVKSSYLHNNVTVPRGRSMRRFR